MLTGTVVTGDGRGRSLGYPTANLAFHGAELEDGVYVACVRLPDGRMCHASISVGNNPTFEGVDEQRVEAFIHAINEDLYGKSIEVALLHKLRDMHKFVSVDELIAQTKRDIQDTDIFLAHCGAHVPLA